MGDLKELLNEANEDAEINFERIKELVQKSAQMREESQEREERAEQYFKTLKERLDQSSSYLQKAKKDLDNISYAFEREKLKKEQGIDYQQFQHKSDEELEEEMRLVKTQLSDLEGRLKNLSQSTGGSELSLDKSIKTLENISKGIYRLP